MRTCVLCGQAFKAQGDEKKIRPDLSLCVGCRPAAVRPGCSRILSDETRRRRSRHAYGVVLDAEARLGSGKGSASRRLGRRPQEEEDAWPPDMR